MLAFSKNTWYTNTGSICIKIYLILFSFELCIYNQHFFALSVIFNVGPYDFRDPENMYGITESSHKNEIYCITRNATEFAETWMDKSNVGQDI